MGGLSVKKEVDESSGMMCLFFYGDSAVVGGRIVALSNGESGEDKFLELCLMPNHK